MVAGAKQSVSPQITPTSHHHQSIIPRMYQSLGETLPPSPQEAGKLGLQQTKTNGDVGPESMQHELCGRGLNV